MAFESCAMDVLTGGSYRLRIRAGEHTAEFFGKYLEVAAPKKLVWTNDEGGPNTAVITSVTFEDRDCHLRFGA